MSDEFNEHLKQYVIKLPQQTLYDPKVFTEFLRTLSKILKNVPFSFALNMVNKRIFFGFQISPRHYSVLENQLYSVFQKVEILEIESGLHPTKTEGGARADLTLKHGDFYPFMSYEEIEGSFFADIFNQLNSLTAQESFYYSVKVRPVDYDKQMFIFKRNLRTNVKSFKDRFNILESIFSKKASGEIRSRALQAALLKNKNPLYQTEVGISLFSSSFELASAKLEPIAQSFKKLEGDLNEFRYKTKPFSEQDLAELESLTFTPNSLYLTAEELSTIFNLPPNTDTVPNLYKILSPKAEPPLGLPTPENTANEDLCLFGQTNYRNIREIFGIKRRDRARHMYVIGKSGSGKSKLMELIMKNDIEKGDGFCVIDPHGDLIENIIPFIPESRVKDVIYFNPADEEFPISFNPIEKVDKAYRQQIATGLIEVFKKIFGANWTPRLEHVLRMTLLALLDAPKASIMSVLLILTDREYRQEIIKSIEDQVVKNFWTNEFAGWSEKFDSEAIMPILNKIGQFVSNGLIRNIVGQEENKIKLKDIMDNKKILLVKLPKGILGEENVSLLGAMLITRIYQTALARADIPENERVPFYLFVDEFQNFATESFSNILSESRKYRLSLTMAHQYVSQLSESIRKTVFGNVGSILSFRLGPEDAVMLEKEFVPRFKAEDITNLGVREIYLKLSIDDEVKEAFSAKTLAVPQSTMNFKDQIVANTRENYSISRANAEREISREKSKEMEILDKLKDENFSAPIL
jgi:hypothetical protein